MNGQRIKDTNTEREWERREEFHIQADNDDFQINDKWETMSCDECGFPLKKNGICIQCITKQKITE